MVKNDTDLMRLGDVAQALLLLTRLPIPVQPGDRGAHAAWAYPLAGLVLGAIAAGVAAVASAIGLPAILSALVALAVLIVTTGALHEDGLADTADGLWGGWTREKRLEIMKDSHIGTYGVLALLIAFAARWSAFWMLFETGTGPACAAIIVAATLSRASMPALMAALPHARDSGLSHSVGAARPATAAVASMIAVAIALAVVGLPVLWAVIGALGVTVLVGLVARTKIGGQTGDVLGASQQIAEIAILFALLA